MRKNYLFQTRTVNIQQNQKKDITQWVIAFYFAKKTFFFKYVKITILIFKVFKKRFSNKDKRTNETLNKLANYNHLSKKIRLKAKNYSTKPKYCAQ